MGDVDRDLLVEIAGGEAEAAELLRLYFDSARRVLKDLRSAIGSRDRVALNKAAHQLAGAAGTCGFMELEQRARAVEMEADIESWDGLAQRAGQLAERLARAKEDARARFPAFAKGADA